MAGTQRHPVPTVRGRSPAAPADGFRPDVQGLRAVAVLLVVASHVLGLPAGGYVGVDVFFVISGYLITGLLLREHARSGRISLRDFYARRVRRLMPAAVLVLAVTNVAAYLLFTGERAGQAVRDSLWSLGFLANVRFSAIGTDYFDDTRPASPVQHYWSLAVEEQFYVVWPLLLMLALWLGRRRGAGAALLLLTGASLVWSVVLTGQDATAAYFSTPARAWELGVGALLAVLATTRVPQRIPVAVGAALAWMGLGGIVAAAVAFTEQTPFPGIAALLPVLATGLVLLGGAAGAATKNPVLVNPVAAYVGKLSYSLYLWHWPVLILSTAVLPEALRIAVPLVLSFVLAALCHHLVEEPVRRSAWLARNSKRRSLARGSGRRAAIAVTAAAALLGGGFVLPALALQQEQQATAAARPVPGVSSTPADLDALKQEIAASVAPAQWPPLDPPLGGIRFAGSPEWIEDKCDNVNSGNLGTCRYGPPDATRTAALFGDSMAISWLPALREALEPRGWDIQVLTRNQCPAPAVEFFRERPSEPFHQCSAHKEWAIDQLQALRPDLVIVSNSLSLVGNQVAEPPGDERYARWEDGMYETLRRLEVLVADVVVLGQPPRAGNVQECVTRVSEPGDCTEPLTEEWSKVRDAEQAAAQQARVRFVDPEVWFCADGQCPAVVGSTPVYTDGRHLTAAYARRLAPYVGASLGV